MAAALSANPLVSDLRDRSGSSATPDFELTFAGGRVGLELKEKGQPYSAGISAVWPEVPEPDLFIVDEVSLRRLVWAEGAGYLVVADRPRRQWHLFGPWELWLAPRRRYERPGNTTTGLGLKGKVLLDARTASATGPTFDVEAFLDLVRRSRAALGQVRAVDIRGQGPLPTVPAIDRSALPPVREARIVPSTPPEVGTDDVAGWGGLSPVPGRRHSIRVGLERPHRSAAGGRPGHPEPEHHPRARADRRR